MLNSLKDLEHFIVSAADGDIGSVLNVLMDDERWAMRYLVLSTNGALTRQELLSSPISFREIESAPRRFHLALTNSRDGDRPSVDMDKPVYGKHERDCYRYCGYAPYWGRSGLWGMGDYPGLVATETWQKPRIEHSARPDDIHLCSANEIRGHHGQARAPRTLGYPERFLAVGCFTARLRQR